MTQAILVLTCGMNEDGSLSGDDAQRVETAIEQFAQGKAPRIIFSGYWSFLSGKKPPEPLAEAYKRYAVAHGIPQEACLCESHSLDTIGNFYFTRKEILEPNGWKHILLVTSAYHMRRSQLLADHILGPEYTVDVCAAPNQRSGEQLAALAASEEKKIALSSQWLDILEPGNIEAIEKILFELHPAYIGGKPLR